MSEQQEEDVLSGLVGAAPALSPLETLRHSTAHVMAKAVQKLFPGTKVTIGPSIESGFYYDFDPPRPFTEDDLAKIEAEMKKIVDANEPFVRHELPRSDARAMFEKLGETYKVELIDGFPPDAVVSYYTTGDWFDLCRGPHVKATGEIKAFKLTAVASAYWRGKETNPQLQRIYGTAFSSQADLDKHLARLEEAKRRDHRRIGKDLDLFSIDETIGAGLVLWHPKGGRVRHLIETFWREEHFAHGYELVSSPHIARDELWKTSGHLSFYKENMFSGMDVDGQQYLAKPMNCPFHCTMFKKGLRSYRELPHRWAELGTVYRYERSGVMHGLLRVRGFTQDDAHLFMTREQLPGELERVTNFCLYILKTFGFTDFKLYLATRPKEFVGDPEIWAVAEAALLDVLKKSGLPFEVDPGGGAFYGPKIDLKLKDCLDREWQCSTIQVDFNLPERFDLEYVGQDNKKQRIVMVHRALLGSMERFFAVLTEHYAGAFPVWLAPVQARVISIGDRQAPYVQEVAEILTKKGFRVDTHVGGDKLGAKIRQAQLEKIPFMLVCGDKEVEARAVAARGRDGTQLPAMSIDAFAEHLAKAAAIPRGGVAPA
ncbi:MAG: threonine--tRNA ligase [Deltaproteobacteria bacterium]|nr:threonine--tRNA ligase [Deltaproteobacteria bacterium]MCW5806557.1 threonine--tRNA ligase [Deltaproteobacteria bacterium]